MSFFVFESTTNPTMLILKTTGTDLSGSYLNLGDFVMDTICRTLSVPEAGKLYFGLGRDGSYQAAKRGDIPVIQIGRRLRVSVPALERMLEEATPQKAQVAQ
jgi:hypothetical protein